MKIRTLTLENFQGIPKLQLVFEGKNASIYGDNATGKTTIFNAVTWLLFGTASTGASGYTPKTKNEHGDVHHLDHGVSMLIELENGRNIMLRKVFKEVWKKKRGSATSEFSGHTIDFYFDGVPMKEKEYIAALDELFGGIERMKILTMPDYFPETLAWAERRKILLDICGNISDEDVVNSNSELKDLPAYLTMPGSTEMYSVDDYRKIAAGRKSEINKLLEAIPARIDEAQKAIQDVIPVDQSAIDNLNAQIEKLQKKKALAQVESSKIPELKKALAEAEAELINAENAHNKNHLDLNKSVQEQIQAAMDEKNHLLSDLSANRNSLSIETDTLQRLNEARESLLREYETEKNRTWNENAAICPTCHRELPAEQVEDMKSEFNLAKSKRLEDINARGQSHCSKDMISKTETKIERLKTSISELETSVAAIEKQITELQTQLVEKVIFTNTPVYKLLVEAVETAKTNLANETNIGSSEVDSISDEIAKLKNQLAYYQQLVANATAAKAQQQRITELEAQEKELAAEYENVERGLYLCETFIRTKSSMLTDNINAKFQNVRFRLFADQINGGLKETCDVMIPSKGGAMVPYGNANNAARINAGLEVISTLSTHWEASMPVFIDNAESITKMNDTTMQTIRLVVSEADKLLRLELGKDE